MGATRALRRIDRRWLGRALGLLVSGVVLVLLLRQLAADWTSLSQQTLRQALHFDPLPLALAWVIQTAGWMLLVATWRQMLGRGVDLPFRQHMRISAYTSLAHVIPGSIWSPASRVAMYRSQGVSGLVVSAALLIEWLLVGLGGLLLYVVFLPLSAARPPQGMEVLAVVAAASLVLLHPRAFSRTMHFAAARIGGEYDAAQTPRPGRLVLWFGSILIVLALSGLALAALMYAVSPTTSIPDAMAAWGLSMAVSNLLIWMPATSILKEAGVVLLLTPLYGSSVIALGVVVVWRIWMVFVQLSWAAIAALAVRALKPGRAEHEARPSVE